MNHDPSPIIIRGASQSSGPSRAEQKRDRLRARIKEFIESHQTPLRELAHALMVLPLEELAAGRWYGVRPNGDLILFSPAAHDEPAVEFDEWKRAAVLFF